MISTQVTARIRHQLPTGHIVEDHYRDLPTAQRNVQHYPMYSDFVPVAESMPALCSHGQLAGECRVVEYRTQPGAVYWRRFAMVPTARCIHNPETILDEERATPEPAVECTAEAVAYWRQLEEERTS